MDIGCASCGRSFNVDDRRVGELAAARCLCGARLQLKAEETQDGAARRLGKYVLLRRIAVGGMGEIYYGKIAGIEGFEREVAIKTMLPHISQDRDFIDMLIKEAKLTVLLNHPNIVQVYDLAREGDEYYIAMEYVPGLTVGTILERLRSNGTLLPYEIPVHITMQLLQGLSYAHDLRGPDGDTITILHRDITPQNVLVTRQGWVKITDFGIARALNEISTTSPGMIKGKLGYIAPEQLEGKHADRRVDIFCAGIQLWEMLAVRRLFKGETEVDTFRLISDCEIPPLSRYRDDIPAEVEAVLHKSLARDRDARFLTAEEFYAALNSAIFPRTADDFRAVTQAFFAEQAGLFDTAEAPVSAEEEQQITGELNRDHVPDRDLAVITDLTLRASNSMPKLQFVMAILFVLLSGVAYWIYRGADEYGADSAAQTAAQTPSERVRTEEGVGKYDAPAPGPQPLSQDEVQLAVAGEEVRLGDCYRQGGARLKRVSAISAKLVIASTGGVARVELEPPRRSLGPAGACVEKVLKKMALRPHPAPAYNARVDLPSPARTVVARASRPSRSASPPRGGPPKPLTGREVQATVQKHSSAIARCLQSLDRKTAPSKLDARVTIDQSGRVSAVDFQPELAQAGAQRCLDKSLRSMRFRRQPVPAFRVTIPLKIEVL